jgi:hypothetical protein
LEQLSPSLAALVEATMTLFRRLFLAVPVDDAELVHAQVCSVFASVVPRILAEFARIYADAAAIAAATAAMHASSKKKGASKKPSPEIQAALAANVALQRILASVPAEGLTLPCLCHGKTIQLAQR